MNIFKNVCFLLEQEKSIFISCEPRSVLNVSKSLYTNRKDLAYIKRILATLPTPPLSVKSMRISSYIFIPARCLCRVHYMIHAGIYKCRISRICKRSRNTIFKQRRRCIASTSISLCEIRVRTYCPRVSQSYILICRLFMNIFTYTQTFNIYILQSPPIFTFVICSSSSILL